MAKKKSPFFKFITVTVKLSDNGEETLHEETFTIAGDMRVNSTYVDVEAMLRKSYDNLLLRIPWTPKTPKVSKTS